MVDAIKVNPSVVQRDWKKVVEESKGQSIFVPDRFLDAVKKWNDARLELNQVINSLAARENDVSHIFRNTMYDMQKYFAENGKPDIWTKDIGFDTNALAEGVFILNIVEGQKR